MKIIVDAFGGDRAPIEILKGCELAVKNLGVEILLVGKESEIKKCFLDNNISSASMTIKNADAIFQMTDSPKDITTDKADTSTAVGLQALADGEGDAFVSAGSTGALVIGASHFIGRMDGIKRAAIGTVLPSNDKPFLLIDSGANVECQPETLHSFAIMGDVYMKRIMRVEEPRIGLANIGTEPTKGGSLQLSTYDLMLKADYNFIGNVEARAIPYGVCDVVVADGFTGNMLLKMYEGTAGALLKNLKAIFTKNILTKLSALLLTSSLKDFKKKMDYTEYGGAPLFGFKKPVIKAHGSSNAKALMNSIRLASEFVKADVIHEMEIHMPKS